MVKLSIVNRHQWLLPTLIADVKHGNEMPIDDDLIGVVHMGAEYFFGGGGIDAGEHDTNNEELLPG